MPRGERPFGLQHMHDTLGSETYTLVATTFVTQVRADAEVLGKRVEAGDWLGARELTSKLRGTLGQCRLDEVSGAVEQLNGQLRKADAEPEAAAEARSRCPDVVALLLEICVYLEAEAQGTASSTKSINVPVKPAKSAAATAPPTSCGVRPFGLQHMYDILGSETYMLLAPTFATQVHADAEALGARVKASAWASARNLTHKLRGTLGQCELHEATKAVERLNVSLRKADAEPEAAAETRSRCPSVVALLLKISAYLEAEAQGAAPGTESMSEVAKPAKSAAATPPPTPPLTESSKQVLHGVRPFGLQRMHDVLGSETYMLVASTFAPQVRVDSEALLTHIETGAWASARKLTHKLRGTLGQCELHEAMKAVERLNVSLRKADAEPEAAADTRLRCPTVVALLLEICVYLEAEVGT